ncbi:hypothetical protein FE257_007685 [Aspergillus nanangensis]|uniref:Vacuolar sorting protein Vps3844 C-terminal domain-containing protein n=1 Tax=Aspergillus nanangensis TaxID=2582783 RepID=A0AAD4CYL1_ASPNN|nr:hypothetical protein FE257_007685 [Aspergillus nanangensis]
MWQLSNSFLALSMTTSLATNAYGASIFAFDPYSLWETSGAQDISGETARRLLELRMGAPMASLGKLDQSGVELLNKFAGSPDALFNPATKSEETIRSLLIVEGVDPELDSSIRNSYQNGLTVLNPSLGSLDGDFWGLLGFESGMVSDERYCMSLVDAVESWVDKRRSVSVSKVALKSTTATESTPSDSILQKLFYNVQKATLDGTKATVLLLPKCTQNKENLTTRGGSGESTLHRLARRNLEGQASLPLSVAPLCYASNSSCNDATNSCSGHGFCYKKSSSADEETAGDCYACKCQETIIRKSDGTVQKLQWGGPACQKRDISSPFFLIAGVSILVVLAISTAVGMLFNVGQGDLPGVINAGVGAAHSQK